LFVFLCWDNREVDYEKKANELAEKAAKVERQLATKEKVHHDSEAQDGEGGKDASSDRGEGVVGLGAEGESDGESEWSDDSDTMGGLLDGKLDTGEGDYDPELLRKYELEKLRYFYAIVEFDSVAVAKVVYDECDGLEFESSANTLDIRFVPDCETFDHAPPRDEASRVPGRYEAASFFTNALQHSKVELTWDQEDPTRTAALRKANEALGRRGKKGKKKRGPWAEEYVEDDLLAYIGSDESEEEEEEEEDGVRERGVQGGAGGVSDLLGDLREQLAESGEAEEGMCQRYHHVQALCPSTI